MTVSGPSEKASRAVIGRLAKTYLAPHWPGLLLCFVLAAGVAGLNTWFTLTLDPAIDGLIVAKSPKAIWYFPLLIAGIGVGRAVLLAIQLRLINRIGHTVVGEVQLDLFSRLVKADLGRLQAAHSGQHVSSMLFDASLVRDASTHVAVNYIQQLLVLIGMFVAMARVDIGLTLLALVGAPFAFTIIRKYSRRTRRATQSVMGETSALSSVILEGVNGVKIVKMEGREDYERARVGDVVRRRQHFLIKGSNAKALAGPLTEVMMTFVIAGILAYAGWLALQDRMDAGSFTSFLFALITASQALRQLGGMQTTLSEGTAAATRLFATLDIEPAIQDEEGAKPINPGPGAIRLEDVTLAYGPGAPALSGVSLEAQQGKTIALVGPSGGGKSSILNLIPRFYDVTSGAVTIDGQDVRNVTLRSLRERIALVTQEPFLFDDTVRANIAYAKPNATDDEIEAAAKAAAAHEFITAFPDGYKAPVGEAGTRLSGGQRQRIAIARAFLKNAPILLLDEATSALDTESEAQVQVALERLMAGRTTIMIAHRLSTVRHADQIFVIDQGRIVETGTHAALIRKKGLYARLAAAQNLDLAPGTAG